MLCKSVKAASVIPSLIPSLIPSVVSSGSVTRDAAGGGGGGVPVIPQLISPAEAEMVKIQANASAAQNWRKCFISLSPLRLRGYWHAQNSLQAREIIDALGCVDA
jgi:hypothetical protein